jgi:hypothetical protein
MDEDDKISDKASWLLITNQSQAGLLKAVYQFSGLRQMSFRQD